MMTLTDQYQKIPSQLNPTDPLFVKMDILKVHDMYKFQLSNFIYKSLALSSPSNFWDWFVLNHTTHSYNTTSNTVIEMDSEQTVSSIVPTNILKIQCSRLIGFGGKMLKVTGPLIWNNLPANLRNSLSLFSFKKELKKHLINSYSTNTSVSGHFYVSKLSLCCMKITISKMKNFFIPPYLPARLKVKNISKDGLKFKIYNS